MTPEQHQPQLQQEQIEQALILDRIDNAIALFDDRLRLVKFNAPLVELWGLSANWLSGQPHCNQILAALAKQGIWSVNTCRELAKSVQAIALRAGRSAITQTSTTASQTLQLPDYQLEISLTAMPKGGCLLIFRKVNLSYDEISDPVFIWKKPYWRSQLFTDITLKIRQSLHLQEILQITVTEVQQLLQADRVLIYRIWPDRSGTVLTEAVVPNFPPLLGQNFSAEVFPSEYHPLYAQGEIRAVGDIDRAKMTPCHVDFLRQIQVQAVLIVPILQQNQLWGLMVAHQRQPRQWSNFDIELLQQLANQLSIAIAQSLLLEALRESEQRFRSMANSSPVFLWLVDKDGQCTFVNQSWLKFCGRTLAQELGKGWKENAHPDDLPYYLEAIRRGLSTLKDVRVEARFRRADGKYRWLLVTGTPRFLPNGTCEGYIASSLDITERKQAEDETRKALEKEKELSELKSRFVSMTSHEFRTPLSTILSSAELLEYYSADWTQEERLEQFQQIKTAVSNMTSLLDDVLLIGQAEANQLPFNPASLNLLNFCQKLIEEFQQNVGDRYTLKLIANAVKIEGYLDEKLLRQILNNLLSNSIKYSPQGGEISVYLSSTDEQFILKIKDRGIGIPPEDCARLFEPFHRGRNVGTIPGTGLGLAIAKKCVSLHGGEITVNSELGVGTTFTVTLEKRVLAKKYARS